MMLVINLFGRGVYIMKLPKTEGWLILSDELIQEVVGGVMIDGKEISEEELKRVLNRSLLKRNTVPRVDSIIELTIKSPYGKEVDKDGDMCFCCCVIRKENGEYRESHDCDIPLELLPSIENIESAIKSYQSRFGDFRDVPDLDEVWDMVGVPPYNHISIEDVLETEKVSLSDGVKVNWSKLAGCN
jgi:hypothetical protein